MLRSRPAARRDEWVVEHPNESRQVANRVAVGKAEETAVLSVGYHLPVPEALSGVWLRTNRVNTNRAAAKVMNSDRLGKKVRPGTFGKLKVG